MQPGYIRVRLNAHEVALCRGDHGTKLWLVAFSLPRFAKALSNRCWLTLEESHVAIPLCNSGIFI